MTYPPPQTLQNDETLTQSFQVFQGVFNVLLLTITNIQTLSNVSIYFGKVSNCLCKRSKILTIFEWPVPNLLIMLL